MGHETIFIKLNIPQNESNQHFNTPNMQPQFRLFGELKIVKNGMQFNVLYLFVILFWMTIFKSDHIIRPHCVNDVWVSVHNGQDFVKNINHTSLQKNWDYNATKQQNNTESFLGQVMMILMVEMVVRWLSFWVAIEDALQPHVWRIILFGCYHSLYSVTIINRLSVCPS